MRWSVEAQDCLHLFTFGCLFHFVKQLPDKGDLVGNGALAFCEMALSDRTERLNAFDRGFGGAQALESAHGCQAMLLGSVVALDPVVQVLSRHGADHIFRNGSRVPFPDTLGVSALADLGGELLDPPIDRHCI